MGTVGSPAAKQPVTEKLKLPRADGKLPGLSRSVVSALTLPVVSPALLQSLSRYDADVDDAPDARSMCDLTIRVSHDASIRKLKLPIGDTVINVRLALAEHWPDLPFEKTRLLVNKKALLDPLSLNDYPDIANSMSAVLDVQMLGNNPAEERSTPHLLPPLKKRPRIAPDGPDPKPPDSTNASPSKLPKLPSLTQESKSCSALPDTESEAAVTSPSVVTAQIDESLPKPEKRTTSEPIMPTTPSSKSSPSPHEVSHVQSPMVAAPLLETNTKNPEREDNDDMESPPPLTPKQFCHERSEISNKKQQSSGCCILL